jgi:hypothetical protein
MNFRKIWCRLNFSDKIIELHNHRNYHFLAFFSPISNLHAICYIEFVAIDNEKKWELI